MNRRRGRPVVSEERPGDSGGPLAALRVSAPGNSARSALGSAQPARRGRYAEARAGRPAGEGQGAPWLLAPDAEAPPAGAGAAAPGDSLRGPLLSSPPRSARPARSVFQPQLRVPPPISPLLPYLRPLPPAIFPPWGRGRGRPEVRRWRAGSAATRPSAAPPQRASDSAPAAVEERGLGGRRVPMGDGVAVEEARPAPDDERDESLSRRGGCPPSGGRKRPNSAA